MKYLLLSLVCATLIGCQTLPTYDLSDQDLTVLKRMESLPNQKCTRMTTEKSTGKVVSTGLSVSTVFAIKSFSKNSTGWYRAYGVVSNIWDSIYFNPSTGHVICGDKNWSNARPAGYNSSFKEFPKAGGVVSRAATTSNPVRKSPESRQGATESELRSIAVAWEGVADLLAGTLNLQQDSSSGIIEITLPNGLGKCSGGFSAQDKNRGQWRVSCPDSKSASGTYVAFGDGRGSKGVGFDNVGRKVTYTIGARLTETQQPTEPKIERVACKTLKQRIEESNDSAFSYVLRNIENNGGTFNPDDAAALVGEASSFAVLKYVDAFRAQEAEIYETCGVKNSVMSSPKVSPKLNINAVGSGPVKTSSSDKATMCSKLKASKFEDLVGLALEVSLNMFNNGGVFNPSDTQNYSEKYEGSPVEAMQIFSQNKDEATQLVMRCNQ